MNSFSKYFSRAFLGMALLLTSGVLTAQIIPPPYQHWQQYSFPYFGSSPADLFKNLSRMQEQLYNMRGMNEQLYRQLQSYAPPNFSYFGTMPPWNGNFMGSASNLQDRGDHYLVEMRLPGATSKDINMRLDGQVLSITVQTQGNQKAETNLGQWQTFFGNIQQVLIFPEAVDNKRIRGQFENGILTMLVPKMGN